MGTYDGTISGGVTLNQPGAGTSKAMTFDGTTGKILTAAVQPGNYWPGSLQDVAIYPRALSPAEIAAHYELRVPA